MSAEFPFLGGVAVRDSTDDLPEFRMWAWDFETDEFIYDGDGNHILLRQNEAMKVWIYKALRTERFSYLAYSWQYGIELKPFIGKVMGVQERKSELKRMIVECLMVNPYIRSINSVTFEESNHAEELQTIVDITTIYGELVIHV